jgi:integrase
MCGYRRKVLPAQRPPSQLPPFDLAAIDTRLRDLRATALSSAYEKQKVSLKIELQAFLSALPTPKTLFTAVPVDICRFLVWKDHREKTQVHHLSCPHLGLHAVSKSCDCPIRLSHKTVDSLIGKLLSIFKSAGREGDWDLALGLGNPAASSEVKQYLKAFSSEQLQAAVTPQQATPLFLNKLLLLSRHIERKMSAPRVAPILLFTMARDAAFFKTLFFSGDRANDLSIVKTQEILRFPKDNGLLFNHVWGKTLRDGSSNLFGVRRHPNPSLCPVKAIETYMAICSELALDLFHGFLFRPTTPRGSVQNKQVSGSTMQARLQFYLREASIDGGETLHSFRAGAAITLALSGAELGDVMSHVGWRNPQTASYYLKLANVLRPGGSSELLASDDSSVELSTSQYSEFNILTKFVTAFPRLSTP